jgi:MSHA biogenesis protein MshL
VESTQGQIARQVVIEAKILEIILDDKHQDGVNWANIVREGSKAFLTASNPLPSIVAGTTEVFTLGIRSGDFYAFIELMEGQGKTNILSSPRISTLNNQKAVIKVGEDEYFITDIASNNSLSAATNTVTQDITWTPFFSGIALDVTPQISDSNNITLHIHPSITRVRQDDKKFSINGDDNSLPMARNTVRESDSIVHAENGQIIVIGGLMQENREENKQGVSLLSRIPYLGNAFRENQGTGRKSELVILLKPTIIGNSQDWNAPIEDSRERMQQLERKQLWK